MVRTRLEIKTLVRSHTGRTKDSLESSLCDSALKIALMHHPFEDASSMPSDITLTEDATSVDISSVSAFNIVTARIVEADGPRNVPLTMKNRIWWDKNVINAEDNTKGWSRYGLHTGSTIHFDGPLESGLELRLRITTLQTFASDSTACPIALLDIFVEHYVTAGVFQDVGNIEGYIAWKQTALGLQYDRGIVGGELLTAINFDKADISEEFKIERPGDSRRRDGISILNDIVGHERYGEIDTWF